jgi:hypothetical protein
MKTQITLQRFAALVFTGAVISNLFMTTITSVPKLQKSVNDAIYLSGALILISGGTWILLPLKKRTHADEHPMRRRRITREILK